VVIRERLAFLPVGGLPLKELPIVFAFDVVHADEVIATIFFD
jgi:hypothetical protein